MDEGGARALAPGVRGECVLSEGREVTVQGGTLNLLAEYLHSEKLVICFKQIASILPTVSESCNLKSAPWVVCGRFQISAKKLYSEICTLPAKLCSLRQVSVSAKRLYSEICTLPGGLCSLRQRAVSGEWPKSEIESLHSAICNLWTC